LHRCLPEFDDIGFDRPQPGVKSLKLRRAFSRDWVTARDLSEGTMFTLAILALAHQPDAPSIVCIEEPDRGIHPRLLEEVRNALYRLSFPESYQENRRPIQVVATTHSPHFLDLFKDNPDQVIVADKTREHGVTFRNLGRDADAQAILEDSLLGQAWTAGAIGGVPLRS
jgi:predicted ATPase